MLVIEFIFYVFNCISKLEEDGEAAACGSKFLRNLSCTSLMCVFLSTTYCSRFTTIFTCFAVADDGIAYFVDFDYVRSIERPLVDGPIDSLPSSKGP